jgi:hypothetical protein
MSDAKVIDPFVSTEAVVEVDDVTSGLLKKRSETAAEGKLVPAAAARKQMKQWLFKILFHEDALADLEEVFGWSQDHHPEVNAAV